MRPISFSSVDRRWTMRCAPAWRHSRPKEARSCMSRRTWGMRKGLRLASQRFGAIHGVIHAAGVAATHNIASGTEEQFEEVLAPKVRGTVVLDAILRAERLDFVCYFSSTSAFVGDFGSCDYA